MVFMGTLACGGHARAVVVATGKQAPASAAVARPRRCVLSPGPPAGLHGSPRTIVLQPRVRSIVSVDGTSTCRTAVGGSFVRRYEDRVWQDVRGHEGGGESAHAAADEDGRAGKAAERPELRYHRSHRARRSSTGEQVLFCFIWRLRHTRTRGCIFCAVHTQPGTIPYRLSRREYGVGNVEGLKKLGT